ncbi:hypothetical protein N2152v2_006568 [Parachlorella kessleri]
MLQPVQARSLATKGGSSSGSTSSSHGSSQEAGDFLPAAAVAAAEPGDAGEASTLGDDSHSGLGVDLQDNEMVLEEWGRAMDEGNWDRAWDIFESAFPVENTQEFPALEDLLAYDPDAEQKELRRARELALQDAIARSRVRRVDDQGRSQATGKRKTSVARVWLKPGAGHIMVNQRPFDRYFPDLVRRNDLITPFVVTGTLGEFDVMARVHGGGHTGQAQALRHGISRALQLWEPELRPALKQAGLLTRDSRIVERKKPGRKKARKSFQWVKR